MFTFPVGFLGNRDPLWDSVVLYLRGDSFTDLSPAQNSVTLIGSPTVASDGNSLIGSVLNFNGTNQGLRIDAVSSQTVSPWTIEMFVQKTNTATSTAILGINTLASGDNRLVLTSHNSTGNLWVNGNSNNFVGPTDLTTSYRYIGITYNGTTLRIREDGTTTYSATHTFSLSDCAFLLATEADTANGGSLGNWHPGRMYMVRVTNALRDTTIVPAAPFPIG